MKKKYIFGAALAFIALIVAYYTLDTKQIAYGTFAMAEQTGRMVQVRGTWVKDSEAVFANNQFTFYMRDDSARVMKVVYDGGKPNNFEIAKEVVCKGKVEGAVYHANDILTKCPSKYQPTAEDVKKSGY